MERWSTSFGVWISISEHWQHRGKGVINNWSTFHALLCTGTDLISQNIGGVMKSLTGISATNFKRRTTRWPLWCRITDAGMWGILANTWVKHSRECFYSKLQTDNCTLRRFLSQFVSFNLPFRGSNHAFVPFVRKSTPWVSWLSIFWIHVKHNSWMCDED